jgi:hypothetical protein
VARAVEKTLTLRISSWIPDEAIERMLALIARRAGDTDDDDAGDFDEAETGEPEARQGQDEDRGVAELEGADVFAAIREEPGNVSVKTMERESAGCARLVAGDDSERQGWP